VEFRWTSTFLNFLYLTSNISKIPTRNSGVWGTRRQKKKSRVKNRTLKCEGCGTRENACLR
jgi:hypothetical protein